MSLILGERITRRLRQTGVRRVYDRLPPRPDVTDEGETLAVIWYCHRDALSLLPSDYPAIDATLQRDV